MRAPCEFDLRRRLFAEGLGAGLLVATVVGSGIMAERLSQGNNAVALLANTLATGSILVVVILLFGPVSGGHFNPVVSLSFALRRLLTWGEFAAYSIVQLIGAAAGTFAAHFMFGLRLWQTSSHVRTGAGIWGSELLATFGLLLTILGCLRSRPAAVPFAVAAFISSAYWFTASTSFANPAVTLARALSDTFAGIRPADAAPFIAMQLAGAVTATYVSKWLWRS